MSIESGRRTDPFGLAELPDYETIIVTVERGVAHVTLHRPDRRNAISFKMMRELYEALVTLSHRSDIHVVVLGASGEFFCPGGDIKAMSNGEADAEIAAGFNPVTFRIPVMLHEMPQLTVAAINGACVTAGLGWACGCDLRIAASSARFGASFLERGIPGDMALPWSLPRIVGPAKARELSFLPRLVGAEEAKAIGLVSDVFDDHEFADRVEEYVAALRGFDPEAVRLLKSHYVAAERMQFGDFSDHESRIAISMAAERKAQFQEFLSGRADAQTAAD